MTGFLAKTLDRRVGLIAPNGKIRENGPGSPEFFAGWEEFPCIQVFNTRQYSTQSCFSKIVLPWIGHIEQSARQYYGHQSTEHILSVAAPTVRECKAVSAHTAYDCVILLQRLTFDPATNIDGDTGSQEIGHIIETAAKAAALPVDRGETVLRINAEEKVLRPKIAMDKGFRSGCDVGIVGDDPSPEVLGQAARYRREKF